MTTRRRRSGTGFRALGVRIAEFPVTEETAREAAAAGEFIVLGAPNVVRGGSHTGWIGATDMVRKGLCSILASDYYYPAMILAAFRLVAEGVLPLPKAWELISAAPATRRRPERPRRACAGRRADIVLVDAAVALRPRIVAVIAAGKLVHITEADRGLAAGCARAGSRRPEPRSMSGPPATPSIMCRRRRRALPVRRGADRLRRVRAKDLDHPPQALGAFADWHELTADPRKYGFHATLKAPFLLADGQTEASLCRPSTASLARRAKSLGSRRWSARSAASSPSCPTRPSHRWQSSPTTASREFEPFRAPLTDHDRQRRLKSPLTPRQIEHLDRWGYPYVFEEFRFHMTLTGSLPAEKREAVLPFLQGEFAKLGLASLRDRPRCAAAAGEQRRALRRAAARGAEAP